jgi:hypothetical protein
MRASPESLTLLGVPGNPGSNERMCFLLQNNLGEDEQTRWTASAKATPGPGVSEASIRDKEAAATAALQTTSRNSIMSRGAGRMVPPTKAGPGKFSSKTNLKPRARSGADVAGPPGQHQSRANRPLPARLTYLLSTRGRRWSTARGGKWARGPTFRSSGRPAWESRSQDKPRPVPAHHGSNRTHKAANPSTKGAGPIPNASNAFLQGWCRGSGTATVNCMGETPRRRRGG